MTSDDKTWNEEAARLKTLFVAVAGILLSACVSTPEPWLPGKDVKSDQDVATIRTDGVGDIAPADQAGKTDKVDDAAKQDANETESLADILELQDDFQDATKETDGADTGPDVVDVLEDVPCKPDCTGKKCGSDACGGSCGTCGVLEECTTTMFGTACTSVMATVAAGSFWMGCNDCPGTAVNDTDCESDEHPYHEVTLGAYKVDKTEATADQFESCVLAGGCTAAGTQLAQCTWQKEGLGGRPINCLTWDQADQYCKWAGKAFCTEAQWEKAARGGCEENGGPSKCKAESRKYPWGNEGPTCEKAVMSDCVTEPQDACSRSPEWDSPNGTCDMAGNVWEWTADWYQEDYYCDGPDATGDSSCSPCGSWWGSPAPWSNPTGPGFGGPRIARGAALATTHSRNAHHTG